MSAQRVSIYNIQARQRLIVTADFFKAQWSTNKHQLWFFNALGSASKQTRWMAEQIPECRCDRQCQWNNKCLSITFPPRTDHSGVTTEANQTQVFVIVRNIVIVRKKALVTMTLIR